MIQRNVAHLKNITDDSELSQEQKEAKLKEAALIIRQQNAFVQGASGELKKAT